MAYKLKSSIDSLCSSPVRAIDPMYNGKKGVQQADFEQFSSAAKMNAEKGPNPIYNLSGKKGLQPSNNPAAAYMTGSPLNNYSLFHTHKSSKPPKIKTSKKNTFYSDQVDLMGDKNKSTTQTKNFFGDTIDKKTGNVDVDATNRAKAGIVDGMKITQSSTDQLTALERQNQNRQAQAPKNTPTPKNTKTVEVVEKKVAGSGSSSAKTRAKKLEKRALTALSKRKTTPRTKDGVEAIRNHNANKKKKASEPKEMSRKQIRTAKQEDKLAGMSRKQVRANKLKRKADSAKAKTNKTIKSIDPTKAKSADTGAKQTKAKSQRAKTIRLQKRVARLKGKQEASKIK